MIDLKSRRLERPTPEAKIIPFPMSSSRPTLGQLKQAAEVVGINHAAREALEADSRKQSGIFGKIERFVQRHPLIAGLAVGTALATATTATSQNEAIVGAVSDQMGDIKATITGDARCSDETTPVTFTTTTRLWTIANGYGNERVQPIVAHIEEINNIDDSRQIQNGATIHVPLSCNGASLNQTILR